MKQFNYLFLFVFFSTTFYLISQTLTFDAKTGDTALDQKLKTMNAQASSDIEAFKADIATEFQTTEIKVSKMLELMEPAEVFFAFNIAMINSISVNKVIEEYSINRANGWSTIISKLGINQQSEKFKDLKNLSMSEKSIADFHSAISKN